MTLTCQNGWPLLGSRSTKLHTWDIPAKNGDLRLTYHNGSLGMILSHCALRLSETVEDMTQFDSHHKLIVDDWGYAVRPVRGQTSGYSNHGGYAFDDNATRHPLGRAHTFSPAQVVQIHKILAMYEGIIRWGGDYHSRKDEMHFEINDGVTMAHAEHVAKKIMKTARGKRILDANPGQLVVIMS
jgi:hypothetical protein